jgi:hypothetical protein
MSEAAEILENEEVEEEGLEPGELKNVVDEETISMAKSMGWVEEENFRGDKSNWVDAEKFVDKGMNDLPILRERLRSQSHKITEMESDITAFKTYHEKTVANEYGRAMKDLDSKSRASVEEGDTDAYDRLQKEKHDLRILK